MELDYDLRACLENNPQDSYTEADIEKVLAVYEGENDGDNWRWILHLKDGRFVYLSGGCDYTGWDCQSNAYSEFSDTQQGAVDYELAESDFNREVHQMLTAQLTEGKAQTWREKTDQEFGL